jgi:hypothetical protein
MCRFRCSPGYTTVFKGKMGIKLIIVIKILKLPAIK